MKNLTKNIQLLDTILSIIFVVQNDEDIIKARLLAIEAELSKLKMNYEILIIDNNSTDNTIGEIRKMHKKIPHIRILVLSRQIDRDVALTAGIDNCIGDYAVVCNIYTDPAEIIDKLVSELLNNNDIVIGEMKKNIIKYGFFSELFLKVLTKLSSQQFAYRQNYLVALNRKAINSMTRSRRKNRNFSYLNYSIGFKKSKVLYTPLHLYKNKIKPENFFTLFLTVSDIIISNSYRPLRILSFLGVISSILFLGYVFIIGIIYFFIDRSIAPQGWISTATILGIMFFLLFTLLAIMSEYIIRTLHEAINEPLYYIADEIDKSNILTDQDKLNVV